MSHALSITFWSYLLTIGISFIHMQMIFILIFMDKSIKEHISSDITRKIWLIGIFTT